MKGFKTAWVTAVTDERTAKEAVVLAKSLRRVITTADLVVLTLIDLHYDLRSLLSKYFDEVVRVDLHNANFGVLPKAESLQLQALNLGRYHQCIILGTGMMVMKNCDDLFLEMGMKRTNILHECDSRYAPLYIIQPDSKTYDNLEKIAAGGDFSSLKELISAYGSEFCDGGNWQTLPSYAVYSSRVATQQFETSLVEVNIVVVERELGDSQSDIERNIRAFWSTLYKEVEDEIAGVNWKCGSRSLGNTKEKECYKDAIAIVGHSCRFPASNSTNEFWELLINGGDGIIQIPADRLLPDQVDDPRFTESRAGYLKCKIDEFDAHMFGISPREAAFMDPQQRLLVQVAWESLENAGINPHSLKGSNTGVFSGVWTHDYEKLIKDSTDTIGQAFHHVVLGNAFSATAARVAFLLGLNGPNVATESGCSSSMVALHLACKSLREGESDLSLVLGANIIIAQFPLAEVPILGKDSHCKTFDDRADGFGRAEGVAVIVLKRLKDAIKNGDRVMGIVRGSAISNEGTSTSFGTPSKFCQKIAIENALKNSGVTGSEIDYVEAHGTGTPVGDPIEFAAISEVYKDKDRREPLLIGSVKTNTGHTESAAGLAGIIKILLSFQNEMIPPHRNLIHLNPNIDMSIVPAKIPLEAQHWPSSGERVRMAGVSSFGISGTNVHAILEEPPHFSICDSFNMDLLTDRNEHILTLSAKTENALKDLIPRYVEYLQGNPDANLADVCYTANTGRAHLKYRLAVTGNNCDQIKSALVKNTGNILTASQEPKVAFLFTGMGSQYFGMAKTLFDTNHIFRNEFVKSAAVIQRIVGVDVFDVLWNEKSTNSILTTINSQMAIFSVQYALVKLWEKLGVRPDVVLGHSLGEMGAFAAAGTVTLEESILMLAERCRIFKMLPPGAMLAIRSSEYQVASYISEFFYQKEIVNDLNPDIRWLDIAVINSDEQIVVSGWIETLKAFKVFLNGKGIKSTIIPTEKAFHCRSVDPFMDQVRDYGKTIKYRPLNCTYVSSVTGEVMSHGDFDETYWPRHTRDPCQFKKALTTLGGLDCNIIVEIGPNPVLLALGMSVLPEAASKCLWLPSIRQSENNWKTLLSSCAKMYCAGININWNALDKGFRRSKLELPNYQFQEQRFWLDYKNGGEGVGNKRTGKILHPLLGRKIVTAGIRDVLFKQVWDLKDFSYLKDHQVGHVVVVPAAAFLEVILAAAKETFLNSSEDTYVVIEKFSVDAPLELEDDKSTQIQVVASPTTDDKNKIHVVVYRFRKLNGYNDEKGWVQYASADAMLQRSETHLKNTLDMAGIKSRCTFLENTAELYKSCADRGIHFGDTFQSIQLAWQGPTEALGKIQMPLEAGKVNKYVYHPIVLDAMLQVLGTRYEKEDSSSVYLPVGVDSFVQIQNTLPSDFYAHAEWVEGGANTGNVFLYDEHSVLLGYMEGVRLVKTTLSSFKSAINATKFELPGMFQAVWRQRDGPLQSRVDMKLIECPKAQELTEKVQDGSKTELATSVDTLICLNYIEMFLEMGWNSKVDTVFTLDEIMQKFSISSQFCHMVVMILDIFEEDGYLTSVNRNMEWRVIREFPSLQQVSKNILELQSAVKSKMGENDESTLVDMVTKLKPHLLSILQGKETSVSELFANVGIDLQNVYPNLTVVIVDHLRDSLKQLNGSTGSMAGSIIRILEIGNGDCSISQEISKALQKEGIPFRYTLTFGSEVDMENAKSKVEQGIEFRVLDLEKGAISQGFCPHFYDIVIASNVIHEARDIRVATSLVHEVLVPHGEFILHEMVNTRRSIGTIFGLNEKFWRFEDHGLRPKSPFTSAENWNKVLEENNFAKSVVIFDRSGSLQDTIIVTRATPLDFDKISLTDKNAYIIFCDDGDLHYQLFTKMSSSFGNVVLLKHSDAGNDSIAKSCVNNRMEEISFNFCNEEETLKIMQHLLTKYSVSGMVYLSSLNNSGNEVYQQLLSVCKGLASLQLKEQISVHFVTRGAVSCGVGSTVVPSAAPIWGMVKSLANEIFSVDGKIIDLDPDNLDAKTESEEIFCELFCKENFVCLRNKKKFVGRYVSYTKSLPPLDTPRGRFTISLPKSNKINDVTFTPLAQTAIEDMDVEIEVKACGLNFRDVFVILKPEMYFTAFDSVVGTDVAGIVSRVGSGVTKLKIGDHVFGMTTRSSAASHVVVDSSLISLKPETMTFADAATLGTGFMTAYHCLMVVAKLRKGETILIHVASGGVGLMAIQLANYVGAHVIATAGNSRKRNYLRSIGVQNVFHSRDLTFGQEINRVTQGRGVDVVLNSITGPGFKETSLSVCAPNARFVEMGKVNIWKAEDVFQRRSDVEYTVVDVEKVDAIEMKEYMLAMREILENNSVSPIPYCRFEIKDLREALNYFGKAEHIGKIVVTMSPNELFNYNSTYLITGGFGAIGLQVATWMVECGAGNLVLVGRSAPNQSVVHQLNTLREKGCRVVEMQADVGDYDQCQNIFNRIKSDDLGLPPLRGVIHSAGVVSDATYKNQTWEKYESVFKAKVQGGWNFHNLTKDMNLEHFVLFSSMAAWLGPISQSSYAGANCFLDSLAQYRQSVGLPAQSINYGAWAELGMAAKSAYGQEGAFGSRPLSSQEGIAALKYIMSKPNITHMGVAQVDINILKTIFVKFDKLMSELVDGHRNDSDNKNNNSSGSETFWATINSLSVQERTVVIRKELETIIRVTLRLPESESLDSHQPFSDLGLDSLMGVEMKNKLQNIFGKRLALNANSLLDYPTIHGLSEYLAQQTMDVPSELPKSAPPTKSDIVSESVYDLVKKDSVLPDDFPIIAENCVKSSKIRNILLTGATGHLGAYILHGLTLNSNIDKVFCLIRAKSVEQARKKLSTNLAKFSLSKQVVWSKITVLLGNVTENRFGVPEVEYKDLCEQIDCVIHLAVKANHAEPYQISKSNVDIRSVNVLGTINILRFAATGTIKRVLYSSSYTAVNAISPDGSVGEEFPASSNNGEGLGNGYALSKFVCEKLMNAAIEKGIPCTVIRYSSLLGNSVSGHFTVDTNLLINMWLTFCQMGYCTDNALFGIPIDVASSLTMDLLFSDLSIGSIFNLCNPIPATPTELVGVAAEFGYTIKILGEEEFIQKMKLWSENNGWVSLFSEQYGGDLLSAWRNSTTIFKQFSSDKTRALYRHSDKIKSIVPNIENRLPSTVDVSRCQFQYAVDNGILNKLAFTTNPQ